MYTSISVTETITQHLERLISLRTLSDDRQANLEALDWVEAQLEHLPLIIKRHERSGHPSLIAATTAVENPLSPRLWLAAHIDVVPGDASLFTARVTDGKLFGRGAYDMKYAIALFITLLQEYGQALADMDIGLMITSDEEVAGKDGVGWLVEQGYAGQAVILPECGESWTLESGAKGITWWDITSQGKHGHASRPWEGSNAITTLTRFIHDVEAALPQEPCSDIDHLHNTINVGLISGGVVANQIPDTATARLDIRLAPDTSSADIRNLLERTSNKYPGISVAQSLAIEPYTIPYDEPTQLFSSIVEDAIGHKPRRKISHGISDSRYFAERSIPVICMPPTGGGQHSAQEWVDIDSLGSYYDILRSFIDQWL